MRALNLVAGLALTVALAGCSDDGGGGSDAKETTSPTGSTTSAEASGEAPIEAETAASVAELIEAAIEVEATEITEENDPNDLIGRPNGYVAAVVLKDPRVDPCNELGVDCGATVEEWPDESAAQERSDYILDLQEGSPMLGSEYHYLSGAVLVRVSGDLKPSEAKEYEAAVN